MSKINYGMNALRLYRKIMKLHMKNMPDELRTLGDLYIKQEFRLHLDSATTDQMEKFMKGWEEYALQIQKMNKNNRKQVKQALNDEEFDKVYKDKFNEEQMQNLSEFKQIIYESERNKKEAAK